MRPSGIADILVVALITYGAGLTALTASGLFALSLLITLSESKGRKGRKHDPHAQQGC